MSSWLRNRYGSRRGYLRAQAHTALFLVGAYGKYRRVDSASVDRFVFVCKGNICRSAFAAAVARRQGVEVASCGIDASDGKSAHPTAIEIARRQGYDLVSHRTLNLRSLERGPGDLFVMMEPQQAAIVEQATSGKHLYSLLGLWGSPVRPYIHDPYAEELGYFETCFDYIERAVGNLLRRVV